MATNTFEPILASILYYVRQFFITSGVSINLAIGVLVTVAILLLTALLVTCLVTWRRKTEKIMSMLRRGSQANTCKNTNVDSKSTNIKSISQLKDTRKQNNKGLSKSISNLKELNNSKESSSKTSGKKSMTKSTSCSALDLPLPSEPKKKKLADDKKSKTNKNEMTIYDDDFEASMMVQENAAYGYNAKSKVEEEKRGTRSKVEEKRGATSVTALVEKINARKDPNEQGHEYEQLEMVQSARF